MAKQQNQQNVQGAQQQAYTSETNATSQSVIEEQISDTVAEGTIDVKLGKESQEKRKRGRLASPLFHGKVSIFKTIIKFLGFICGFLTMKDKRYLIFYRRGVSSGKNISSRENSRNRFRTIKISRCRNVR